MKAMEWSSTRVRVAESTSPARRSTDIPVMKDRYDGNSGRTQGERNENSPAENATATPRDSVIAAYLSIDSKRSQAARPSHSRGPLAKWARFPWRSMMNVEGKAHTPYDAATDILGSSP